MTSKRRYPRSHPGGRAVRHSESFAQDEPVIQAHGHSQAALLTRQGARRRFESSAMTSVGVPIIATIALLAAFWPAWRVVRLGASPTYAELLELRCLSPTIAHSSELSASASPRALRLRVER